MMYITILQIFPKQSYTSYKLSFQQKRMSLQKLFEKSEPVMESHFFINNLLTKLVLYDGAIKFSNQRSQCLFLITFDFSFDVNKVNNGWMLIINTPETIKFLSMLDLEEWENSLSMFMKRQRFHDHFKGIKRIGKGNFASVYLTQRMRDNKYFAVKAFQKQSTYRGVNGKQGLENQIKVLRKIRHPNISRLEQLYESQNSIYLVMQLIQGRTLADILEEQKMLTLFNRKRIIKGMLSGLAQMESKGIVHRDIKPENIMIDLSGEPKIVDFGLATETNASNYLFVRCGTPGYVAPEILSIKDAQIAKMNSISDVFSAGAIFYHMIFGKSLFQGNTNSEVVLKNKNCSFVIPSCSQMSPYEQLTLLRRMLDISPETRITASQALRSNYFIQERTPLKPLTNSYPSNNLIPLKHVLHSQQQKVQRIQNSLLYRDQN